MQRNPEQIEARLSAKVGSNIAVGVYLFGNVIWSLSGMLWKSKEIVNGVERLNFTIVHGVHGLRFTPDDVLSVEEVKNETVAILVPSKLSDLA